MSRMTATWGIAVVALALITTNAAAFSYSWGPQELDIKIKPGQTVSRTFQVTNGTGTTAHFQSVIYDWTFEDSKNRFVQPGSLPTSALTWLTVTPERFRLQPSEQQLITVIAAAPPDAAGARFAGIFAETVPADQNPDGWNMGIGARLGVLVPIRVLGSGTEAAEVASISLSDEARDVAVVAANVGDVHLRPTAKVALMREGQIIGTAQSRGSTRLLPGQRKVINIPLELELDAGTYDILGILSYGEGREVPFSETLTLDLQSARP